MQVREKVLSIIVKIMQYGPPDLLEALLKGIPISSFIASLLGNRDTAILAVGVRLSELLMLKLPAIFATMFLKEGVFHSLEQLAREAPASAAEKKASKRSSSRLKVCFLFVYFWDILKGVLNDHAVLLTCHSLHLDQCLEGTL